MASEFAEKVQIVGADGDELLINPDGSINTSGGGGGGGAVTVADGADVTQGAIADAVVAAGANGTVSAKLRRLTTDVGASLTLLGGGLPAALVGGRLPVDVGASALPAGAATQATLASVLAAVDGVETLLAGGLPATLGQKAMAASLAVVLASDQSVVPVGGTVAAGLADSGNPVKVGGKYNSSVPTFTDGQRGDLQLDARGNVKTVIQRSDGAAPVGTANFNGTAVSAATYLGVGSLGHTWDGSNWIPTANTAATLLASAARTATTSSPDQTNSSGKGVIIVVNVTAEAGTTTLTLTIQGKDPISSNYYDLIAGIIVYNAATDTPTVTRAVAIYPGVLAADAMGAGNASLISAKSLPLPRTWRATITPSDASSHTYSISAVTIL